ncbi:adenylate/guanylate cyclase domain-containing protein [Gordonia sp. PDNC005]|uniref:adenylate/guanylate cyclase domain-containing protein n=1 Tax=Gordonia sp. PDNC005 TaxID=2811424 RepID=UPI001965C152|nr:adenylate/guanylate cyclase domain-containing protein [Gordonia sp. PDNC005]QRY64236.1 adenylate/guanylate cyclase domain-containing protein [Gordonia sp. PDNC005]
MVDNDHDDVDTRALAEAVESILLGGDRTLSPNDLADRTGIDADYSRRLWRSMGFPITDDDAITLTDRDLAAMQRVKHALDLDVVSPATMTALARQTGQVFSQLAESEGDELFRVALAAVDDGPGGKDALVQLLADDLLPLIESIHAYVWRRQLAAYVARTVARYERSGTADVDVTVGFADISGFTSLSRHATASDLAGLLELFESVATDAVGAHDGRVVKLIGDAVLFTTAEPAEGIAIAADLLGQWPSDWPPVRAGLATGTVLRRVGDVFGPTVNIASRLTSLSRPNEIRVDERTATALAGRHRFVEQDPQDVRGYDSLRSWTLSGAPEY